TPSAEPASFQTFPKSYRTGPIVVRRRALASDSACEASQKNFGGLERFERDRSCPLIETMKMSQPWQSGVRHVDFGELPHVHCIPNARNYLAFCVPHTSSLLVLVVNRRP